MTLESIIRAKKRYTLAKIVRAKTHRNIPHTVIYPRNIMSDVSFSS